MLDLSTLEAQKDSFITAELRKHFSDILYRVKTQSGRPIFIYQLFEHKSFPDEDVAFQVLRYKVRIWEEERAKTGGYSPIIAIVVYHGTVKWSVSQNFSGVFQWQKEEENLAALLSLYVPEFAYHLVDLSAISDDQIKGTVWLRVLEYTLKHIFDPDLGKKLPELFLLIAELIQQPSGMEMLITLLTYMARAGKGVSKPEL